MDYENEIEDSIIELVRGIEESVKKIKGLLHI